MDICSENTSMLAFHNGLVIELLVVYWSTKIGWIMTQITDASVN